LSSAVLYPNFFLLTPSHLREFRHSVSSDRWRQVDGSSCGAAVAVTALAAQIDGGQCFGGFSDRNARERMNFGSCPIAFYQRW